MVEVTPFVLLFYQNETLILICYNLLLSSNFNFQPSFKLQWCCARDLFGSQIPVTTEGFEL